MPHARLKDARHLGPDQSLLICISDREQFQIHTNTVACDISKLSQIIIELSKMTLVGVKCLDGMALFLVKFDFNSLLDQPLEIGIKILNIIQVQLIWLKRKVHLGRD